MSHSLVKIWVHGIFGTKDRLPLIKTTFSKSLNNFIENELTNSLNCKVRIINGTSDHIHILFLLDQGHSIGEVFKQIKGSSSHWVNQNNFINTKFAWQTGYGAFSVSESMVDEVEKYIDTQEEHHRKRSFEEECRLLAEKYGLVVGNR